MAAGDRNDPLAGYRFLVELDGLVVGGFAEASGLSAETETEEYREGGLNGYLHKLPGAQRFPNLVLKRGLTHSDTLWTWYRDASSGDVKRKNGSVILQDGSGNEAWRWNFVQAYPVKWNGPDLKADGSAVAFESVELAHNGLAKD
ncbi:MAG: phage tail protein [Bacillota bacterium]